MTLNTRQTSELIREIKAYGYVINPGANPDFKKNLTLILNKQLKKLKTNFYQTVKLLSNGEFHDGTSIGKKLNITRAGVWKVIKKH